MRTVAVLAYALRSQAPILREAKDRAAVPGSKRSDGLWQSHWQSRSELCQSPATRSDSDHGAISSQCSFEACRPPAELFLSEKLHSTSLLEHIDADWNMDLEAQIALPALKRWHHCGLERQFEAFVEHYNHVRYHESLNILTPSLLPGLR